MLFAFVTAMSSASASNAEPLRMPTVCEERARSSRSEAPAGSQAQQGDEERDGTQSMAHETPPSALPGATGLALEDRESPLQILHVAF